ncbi:MAG: class I SAM-dependent methyltransferase [Thermoguttaceae bacterium]|jgi:ubiquinone/menaquinone biosynthesis C-methylase UbiE
MENCDRVEIDLASSRSGLPKGLIQPAKKCHTLQTSKGNICEASLANSVVLWGGRIPDFIDVDGRRAVEILGWSDSFVNLAAAELPIIRAGDYVAPNLMTELQAEGLADSHGKLTELGEKLAYHLVEYNRQSDPSEAYDLAEYMELGNESRILDIGCGAGQTLFRLQRFGPAECIGIDYDIESLAWGCRWQTIVAANPVNYVCASGEAIPFANNRFTHVFSRVALNYMHQACVVKEVVRVMEPGGMLSFRVMNVGYYLRLLSKSRNIQRVIANLYKLGWGCVAALTGFQFQPQRRLAAKETFAPLFRLRKLLRKAGCDVVHWKNNTTFLGFPDSTTLIAKKRR